MNFFSNVKIPVFGRDAEKQTAFVVPSTVGEGSYFADDTWLNAENYVRTKGVSEGIARSIDYNTVMRQCSVFAALFANILSYRNSLTHTPAVYKFSEIGTDESVSGSPTIEAHIGKLSDIFSVEQFLADNEVLNRHINNSAVSTLKIAPSAVTTERINNEAVTSSKLGLGLIEKGTDSENGITVTLTQTTTANARKFNIGLSAALVTRADNANKVRSVSANSDTFYLAGHSGGATGDKELKHSTNVSVQNGNTLYASFLDTPSDARLKQDIEPVGKNQVKALVEGVKIKTFAYKDSPDTTCVGVLAQDIQDQNTVLGDLLVGVNKDTEMLSVHESKLVYILWDYVQQQSARIDDLEKRLKTLEEGRSGV